MTAYEMQALENTLKAMWKCATWQQMIVDQNVEVVGRSMLTEKGNKQLLQKLMLEANGALRFAMDVLDDLGYDGVTIVGKWLSEAESDVNYQLDTSYHIEYKH